MESRLEEILSIGINCMSLAVWLVEDKKCSAYNGGCSRFRFGVRVIYGTEVFIKTVF